MMFWLTSRRSGRHSARVTAQEIPRNVAEVGRNVAVTSITHSDASTAAAGGIQ